MHKIMKCTMCGSKIKNQESGQVAICEACGCEYSIASSLKLGGVGDALTGKLSNLRALQSNSAAANDVRNLSKASMAILEIVVDDYISKYYYSYAENVLGNNNYLAAFYDNDKLIYTPREIEIVLNHIYNYSDLRDRVAIESFILSLNGIESLIELEKYKTTFRRRKLQEDYYDDIPRDVFICHRSTDNVIAQSVVNALERDGNRCWISTKNLRPNDSENYWDNIKKAIASCKIFLVISSEDAMISKDVKNEINMARALDKPRLEYKIDTSQHTSLFDNFFDGKMWVEGYSNSAINLAVLCSRVYQENEIINKSDDDQLSEVEEIKQLLKRQSIASSHMPMHGVSNIPNLIKTARIELEDGAFDDAEQTIDKIADINIECAEMWWLRLMNYTSCKKEELFNNVAIDLSSENTYIKAIKYADSEQKKKWSDIVNNAKYRFDAKQEKLRFAKFETEKQAALKQNHENEKNVIVKKKKIINYCIIGAIIAVIFATIIGICVPIDHRVAEYTFTKSVTGRQYVVTAVDSNVRDIRIPNTYKGLPVSVDQYLFSDNNVIETVVLPEGIKTMPSFYNCKNMREILIPTTVSIIPAKAFTNCSKLTEVFITDNVEFIGTDAFNGCSKLIVYAEDSSKSINWEYGWNSSDCTVYWGLKNIIIDADYIYEIMQDGNIKILSCEVDSATVEIDSVIKYRDKTYSITSIGENAFYANDTLTSLVLPDSITTIAGDAFSFCRSLKTILLSDNLISIGDGAFNSCESLNSVEIPDKVESIGYMAFAQCRMLKSIIIPNSVDFVGAYAFAGCSSLTIYSESISKPYGWENNWNDDRPVIWGYKD